MFTEAFQTVVESILMSVLIAAIGTFVPYGMYKLNQWFKEKLKVLDSEYAINMFAHIGDTIESVVNHTTQTYVQSLKSADKFDAKEQIKALETSKKNALKMLNKEAVELIEATHGDINKWIESQIESVIVEQGLMKILPNVA